MKTGRLFLISLGVCAVMVAIAFYAAAQVAPGTELPTHWNAAGEVDGTMPALRALLFPAGMVLLLSVIFAVIPRIEPLQDRLEGSAPLLRTAWIGTVLLLVFVQLLVGAQAFGIEVEGHFMLAPVGVLLMFLGNMLPKSRPGFFVGIRTPWTIVDEDIWIATHRLGGKLMMLAGAVLVVLAFAPVGSEVRAVVTLAAVFGAALVPVVYSWWRWDRKKRAG